jgi:hypothetical protein
VYNTLEELQNFNCEEVPKPFKAVKIVGFYPNAPETGYFQVSSEQKAEPHATLKAKIIYAVRDQSILEAPEIFEKGDGQNEL